MQVQIPQLVTSRQKGPIMVGIEASAWQLRAHQPGELQQRRCRCCILGQQAARVRGHYGQDTAITRLLEASVAMSGRAWGTKLRARGWSPNG
jgi:hypothetical protein